LSGASRATDLRTREIALVEGIADQIGTALQRDQLSAEVMRLKHALHERYGEDRIIGQARTIRRAIELALNVADTQTSVLIQGESGTGKELLANLIHLNSGREDQPYIKLNCGAIPETLLESELFGHEKGAFTDARARRRGRFEEADGGTLFLDEVGEMSLGAQVRLLRVLQDGEFHSCRWQRRAESGRAHYRRVECESGTSRRCRQVPPRSVLSALGVSDSASRAA
jgi:Nif-specific regulatory protein